MLRQGLNLQRNNPLKIIESRRCSSSAGACEFETDSWLSQLVLFIFIVDRLVKHGGHKNNH